MKQTLLISKCWDLVPIFENTERTEEAPSQPRGARGHPAAARESPAPLNHLGEAAVEQAVTLPTGLLPCPVPASRHLRGLDSEDPWILPLKMRPLNQW